MTTAQKIIDRAHALGIKARLWQKAAYLRIYAHTGRKDMSVFLDCEGTPDEIEGAAMRVACHIEQHPHWIRQQIHEHRQRFIGLFHAYVFEMYRDTGPLPNGYGPDINGMIDEARAFVAACEAAQAQRAAG